MFCSTIIPTVGRPTLTRAVESVLNQSLPADSFELIVVNDSGQPLPEADWQTDERVRIIHTQQRERSVARNTGAAVPPTAVSSTSSTTTTGWLPAHFPILPAGPGTAVCLALRQHAVSGPQRPCPHSAPPPAQRQRFLPALAGEWIPLQASLIDSTAFFEEGGFNPLLSGPEDIDLLRRMALRHDVVGIEAIVAHMEWGSAGSTTDYDRHPTQSRWAREAILDEPGVFGRLSNPPACKRIIGLPGTAVSHESTSLQPYGTAGSAVCGRPPAVDSMAWQPYSKPAHASYRRLTGAPSAGPTPAKPARGQQAAQAVV
jgi:hypothetical protein